MTEDKPIFRVQKIESSYSAMIALAPQFQPSNLTDNERRVYDALREAGAEHYTGVFSVPDIAESKFEEGETVALFEVMDRYEAAFHETHEALMNATADFVKQLAPVMKSTAEAMEPLVEIGEKLESTDSS